MDNGFETRSFRLLEGFGYTTSQLRTIYSSYSGLPEIDTTTVPGRSCLKLPAGSYIDLRLTAPSSTLWDINRLNVLQAKLYLDADTYTSVSANSLLASFSTNSGFTWLTGAGLSPNTSADQDNWYLRFADGSTDYATMNPQLEPSVIPQRTWVDFKLVLMPVYSNISNDDEQILVVFVNNYAVAYAAPVDQMDQANANDLFYGIRLEGLANQSGPTLWRDVMVYSASASSYRSNFVDAFTNPFYYLGTGGTASKILKGDIFVPMTASVYDVTPTTADGGINEFVTVGTGSAITALSNIDTNQYVTSTAASQDFRLKIGLPAQYTSEDSTLVSITDDSEVLAFSYLIRAKDLNGTNSTMRLRMGDETNTTYQYRYYKLRLGNWAGGTTDLTSHWLQQIFFTDNSFARIVPGGSTTMRLDNVYGQPALETDPVDRTVNTTLFTGLLTNTNASANIAQPYRYAARLTGVNLPDNLAHYMDLHIDYGVGNVGPNWYSLAVNQTQGSLSTKSMVLYGSDDQQTWYLLSEMTNLPTNTDVTYLINRRHPDYANGTIETLGTSFQLNAAQFDQVTDIEEGDPFSAGNPTYTSKVPTPWRQFKNYTIGIEEI